MFVYVLFFIFLFFLHFRLYFSHMDLVSKLHLMMITSIRSFTPQIYHRRPLQNFNEF